MSTTSRLQLRYGLAEACFGIGRQPKPSNAHQVTDTGTCLSMRGPSKRIRVDLPSDWGHLWQLEFKPINFPCNYAIHRHVYTPASPQLPVPSGGFSKYTLGVMEAKQHAPVCWTLSSQHPVLRPVPVEAAAVLHGPGLHGPLLIVQAVLQGVPAPPLKLLRACRTLCLPERPSPARLHSMSTALPIAVTQVSRYDQTLLLLAARF